jgi:putative peptidoglycan lipid II flippase
MKLLKSTAIVSALTFLSRIFGFVRESAMATYFGASAATDAFLVAFRLPNMLRQLFSEGSFATAFVPILSEYKNTRSETEKRELINHVAGALTSVLLVITAIGVLGAQLIVYLIAPGYWSNPEQTAQTVDLLRITFPYIFFVSLCGLSAGILNTHGRFAVPALTPILLNVAMIAGCVWAHYQGASIKALAWSVIVGGALQLLCQIPALMRAGLLPKPKLDRAHEGVRRVIRNMVPTMFGASVSQVNMLIDIAIATALVTGSVTWLSNADRLIQLPQGVFGVALSAVILPHLSGRFAKKDGAGFSQSLDWALRMVLIISIPASLTLVWLAEPFIWTVFGRGKYTAHDVQMAALSLSVLALGLPAFMSVKVLAPGFFSRQDTKTPVKAAVTSLISNTVLCGIFVLIALQINFYAPHAAMSLASALAGFINAGLLLMWLRRGIFHAEPGWLKFFVQLGVASLVLSAVFYGALQWSDAHIGDWNALSTRYRFAFVLVTLAAGAVLYLGTLYLCGLNPKQLLDQRSRKESNETAASTAAPQNPEGS